MTKAIAPTSTAECVIIYYNPIIIIVAHEYHGMVMIMVDNYDDDDNEDGEDDDDDDDDDDDEYKVNSKSVAEITRKGQDIELQLGISKVASDCLQP